MIFGYKAYLQQVLDASSAAQQIRSFQNEILLSNAAGESLFGTLTNPFAFLEGTLTPESLEKLKSAYQLHCRTNQVVTTPQATYAVALYPLKRAMVLSATDITAQKEIGELVHQEQLLLQDSLDSLPVAFYIIASDGHFKHVNDKLCQWLGESRKTLLTKKIQHYLKNTDNIFETGDNAAVFKGKNKQSFMAHIYQSAIEMDGQTLFEGVVVKATHTSPFMPVTQHPLWQRAPLGMAIINAIDCTLLDCNEAFAKNLATSDPLGQPLTAVLDAETAEMLTMKLAKLTERAHKQEECELTFMRPDQEKVTFSALMSSLPAEDRAPPAVVLYLTETNERKNLEMQLNQAQKLQAMGQITGGVAHGFADLLLQKHGMGDPSFSDLMQIKHSANRAAGVVKQLLAFSRKQPVKSVLINMGDAFSNLTGLLVRTLGTKIQLVTECSSDLGWVKTDLNQLTQVFLNLAVNARDAMLDGGTLRIRAHVEKIKKKRSVGLDTLIPGKYVVISVADTGCGIDPKDLPRIFEPFFSTKEGIAGSGTGLGLSTVYGIVTQANGYIDVKSELGKGTTFTVYLPCFEPKAADATVPEKDNPTPLPTKATIVVVDDEPAVRTFSARVLKNKGFKVIEFENGLQAFEAIKKGLDFDLLITDMIMQEMDGETLAKKTLKKYPHAKVILMSGYSEDMARHGQDNSALFSFLAKPFSLTQLTEKVKEVLSA